MEHPYKRRQRESSGLFSLRGILCVSLAFLVFTWGAHYKLSLYTAGHVTSPAKVCTRGSDAAKSALDHAADGRGVAQTLLSLAGLVFQSFATPSKSTDWLTAEADEDFSPLNQAPTLYLRPPPDPGRFFV